MRFSGQRSGRRLQWSVISRLVLKGSVRFGPADMPGNSRLPCHRLAQQCAGGRLGFARPRAAEGAAALLGHLRLQVRHLLRQQLGALLHRYERRDLRRSPQGGCRAILSLRYRVLPQSAQPLRRGASWCVPPPISRYYDNEIQVQRDKRPDEALKCAPPRASR